MSVFIGVLLGCIGATAWAIAARTSISFQWRRRMTALILSIDTALLVTAFFRHTPDAMPVSHDLARARYGEVAIIAMILIGVAVFLLQVLNRKLLIAPVVALINGLHFVGLWWATGLSLFAWLSVALAAVAFLAFYRFSSPEEHPAFSNWPLFVAESGNALALWSACFWVLWRFPA